MYESEIKSSNRIPDYIDAIEAAGMYCLACADYEGWSLILIMKSVEGGVSLRWTYQNIGTTPENDDLLAYLRECEEEGQADVLPHFGQAMWARALPFADMAQAWPEDDERVLFMRMAEQAMCLAFAWHDSRKPKADLKRWFLQFPVVIAN